MTELRFHADMRIASILLLGLASCTTTEGSGHRSWSVADVECAIVAAPLSVERWTSEDNPWDAIRRCKEAQTVMYRVQPCAVGQRAEIEVRAAAHMPTDQAGLVRQLATVYSSVSARVRAQWTLTPGPPGRAVLEWTVEVSETSRPLPFFMTLLGSTDGLPVTIAVPDAVIVAESGREEIATGRWYARELSVCHQGEGVPSSFLLLFLVEPRDGIGRVCHENCATTRR